MSDRMKAMTTAGRLYGVVKKAWLVARHQRDLQPNTKRRIAFDSHRGRPVVVATDGAMMVMLPFAAEGVEWPDRPQETGVGIELVDGAWSGDDDFELVKWLRSMLQGLPVVVVTRRSSVDFVAGDPACIPEPGNIWRAVRAVRRAGDAGASWRGDWPDASQAWPGGVDWSCDAEVEGRSVELIREQVLVPGGTQVARTRVMLEPDGPWAVFNSWRFERLRAVIGKEYRQARLWSGPFLEPGIKPGPHMLDVTTPDGSRGLLMALRIGDNMPPVPVGG